MITSIVLFLLPLIYARLLNIGDLSHFAEIKTNLLNFSSDTNVLEYTFDAFGHTFHLELERNTGLSHPNYREYTLQNGKLIESPPRISPTHHCYYHGRVRGVDASSVAVSLCQGVKGLIQAYGEDYVIHPNHLTTALSGVGAGPSVAPKGFHFPHYVDHIFYPAKALKQETGTCGVAHNAPHVDFTHAFDEFQPKASRRLLASAQYVELMTVNDYRRSQDKGPLVEDDTLSIVNIANTCYSNSDFDPPVTLVLVAQVTWVNGDPYTTLMVGTEASPNDLLNNFLNWAYEAVDSLPKHDSHLLVSGFDFQGSTVGLAPVGGMCDVKNSGAITQAHGYSDDLAGATFAHELGHTLGMNHDLGQPGCPVTGFVMQSVADASKPAATEFSPCSKSDYNNWLDTKNQHCLDNIPTTRWGDGVCGNGIVETGEHCDCGSDPTCANDPCCNGPICRLKAGSEYQCSATQICCTSNCLFIAESTKFRCHQTTGTCDSEQFCDGKSGACPTTGFAKPGTTCTDSYAAQGTCYSGICHTWRGRCRTTNPNYNECGTRPYNASLGICEQQFCTDTTNPSTPQTCFSVNGTNPNTTFAEDGVPCNSDNQHQCLSGQCLPSSALYTELDKQNPLNWAGLPVSVDVNKIVTYAAIALGIGLILSCFWRLCCNRQKRIVYVSRMRGNKTQVPIEHQVEGQGHNGHGGHIPAGKEGQGQVDVGGGLVLEFGGRSGTAVLPPGWTSHYTSDGRPYWFHAQRGETSWTFPTQV